MNICKFNDEYINNVVSLWNEVCKEDNFLYKPFKIEGFKEKFINNPNFEYEGTFVAKEGNEIIGFANGIFRKNYLPNEIFESVPGYVTIVLVRKDMRNKGYGTQLLKYVENYLIEKGKKKICIDFFNPINLEWYIPGTEKHDHPNAPGVDIMGDGYKFIKKMGYIEKGIVVAMYRDLRSFELPDNILERLKTLKAEDILIEYYDALKHFGLQQLFDSLRNEYWRKEINDNLSSLNPFPVLVATKKGRICGFAGPIAVQQSGRGRFTGIGVDPKYRGLGIGKALFFKLCESFKNEGAVFMSIFTGTNNIARKMYEEAGFKVVREWALFEKEV